MKLLILGLLWAPTTFILLTLSMMTLLNYDRYQDYFGSKSVKREILYFDNEGKLSLASSLVPSQDARTSILKKFLASYNSPLIESTDEIIKQSDIYGLDYALIPAIAMQESGGCKVLPPGSHNCWGFGIYGDKTVSFNNYSEAINAVAKTIKEAYIKKGLTNPTLVEDRWTPSSKGNWSYSVNFFIGKIRELERNYHAT
ncbi:MAG: hypothetical protein UV73_C0002G0073 [Candidatus Gottesmanbacteria bacterium GW2011_GWA2_43_14]|uniref:Mannosyl-glycoprotein endo-beta-N-acetylglucosamidase-like domain-containing protein n=1 Tax=Candidatus Gottesmanbacteria bacterium GW2011_GWA2_43_14 TaxID=1618443 RepID=A0A0G1DL32_9BACT|nr:MAG: hypothetical protein UV73_C0002G0073 [Candidatus Gottesmanbacteria bacterium GW2011_GWA2_43_14]